MLALAVVDDTDDVPEPVMVEQRLGC